MLSLQLFEIASWIVFVGMFVGVFYVFVVSVVFFSVMLGMNYLWVVIFDQINFDLCSDKKKDVNKMRQVYVKKT